MNLAGELVLSRNQLHAAVAQNNVESLATVDQRINQVTAELQDRRDAGALAAYRQRVREVPARGARSVQQLGERDQSWTSAARTSRWIAALSKASLIR